MRTFLFIFSIFPFSGEQVRVLLFRECDWTGRRLLFDSSAVQKVSISTRDQNGKLPNSNESERTNGSRSFIEICNGYGYTYDQTSCESNNIGEMVFGSVAMSFKGTSLKVRLIIVIAIEKQLIYDLHMFRYTGCKNQHAFYALKYFYRQFIQKVAFVGAHQRTM